jgi:hypothetical protein
MAVYMLVVLVRDGVRCASHGLVVVDVGVSGSSHDFSVIARLITSKNFFYAVGRPVKFGKPKMWGEYEKKGMQNYAAGNGLRPTGDLSWAPIDRSGWTYRCNVVTS